MDKSFYEGIIRVFDGGPGSGNFGHFGRKGKIGGSSSLHIGEYLDKDVINNPENHSLGRYVKIKNGKPRFDPERLKLHYRIVQDLANGVPKTKNPVIYFSGGGAASGKGTAISKIDLDFPSDKNNKGVIIDPDIIKGKLPEFDRNNPESAPFVHEESSWVSKRAFEKYCSDGDRNVLMDGTLAGNKDKVIDKIREAKKYGYPVKANYVTVNNREALERAYKRYLNIGRLPNIAEIIRTHQGVSSNFEDVYKEFDEGNLIDNNGKEPRIIATFKNGELQIKDKKAYKDFLDKRKDSVDELIDYFYDNLEKWEKEWLASDKGKGKKLRVRPQRDE